MREELEETIRSHCDAGELEQAATVALEGYGRELLGYLVATMRSESLRMLHEDEAAKFAARQGFGLSRMPKPGASYLPQGTPPPVPLAAADIVRSADGQTVTLPATHQADCRCRRADRKEKLFSAGRISEAGFPREDSRRMGTGQIRYQIGH